MRPPQRRSRGACQEVWIPSPLWARVSNTALLSATGSGWESTGVIDPSVLKFGATYRMYYSGLGAGSAALGIGIATSTDGKIWARGTSNPVLAPSGSQEQQILCPQVLLQNNTYFMYYSAYNGTNWQLFLAQSTDGLAFTRVGLVLGVGGNNSWDQTHVHCPSILPEGGGFTMWYSGYNSADGKWRMGRATSVNGTAWTKDATNPLMDVVPGTWESGASGYRPNVIKVRNTYHMLYTGGDATNNRTGEAVSMDGKVWTRAPYNPVLNLVPGAFDSVHNHSSWQLIDNGTIWVFFSGHDGARWSIGAAMQDTH